MQNTSLQAHEQIVSEVKYFLIFFQCISLVQTQPLPAWGRLKHGGDHFYKLGKEPLGHATNQITST